MIKEGLNFSDMRKEMFEIFMDPELKGKIVLNFDFVKNSNEIEIVFLHSIPEFEQNRSEIILAQFPHEYPHKPPSLRFQKNELSNIFLMSEYLDEENWGQGKPSIRMHKYLVDIYTMIQKYHESEAAFFANKNYLSIKDEKIQSEESSQQEKNRVKKLLIPSAPDNENSETKNLNRHFKSKLKEILRELVRQYHENNDSRAVQFIFSDNQVGFQEIRKALSNTWFNKEVKWQMKNGKFLNKIMKGMMGIRSKKLMIKYFHVMKAAVEDPQSFICWKYQ